MSHASNSDTPSSGRYTIGEKIGQGGMSIVYPARDSILHRAVAVKVLKKDRAANDQAVRRFLDEARITGQLQHPGVPPIHDLGSFEDGRPFLAMKLIKGDTLEHHLRSRRDGTSALDFLQIFEQIAQTVAFAHSKRVINRDLKPANVMVGAFGEVQVLDWGLAKVLSGAEEYGAESTQPEQTYSIIDTGGDGGSETIDGTALGTPAFMPPEQARGDLRHTDERADVFALGGILCAILTGKPTYSGSNTQSVMHRAKNADLSETFTRLDRCGADAELIALAKHCLAAEPDERPADAMAVANAMTAYRAGVAERLRTAELERAAAVARVVEQKKKRRVQLALAAAIGLILLGGVGFAWYRADRRAERIEAEAKQIQLEGERKAVEERAALERGFQEQNARRAINDSLALALRLRKQYRFRESGDAIEQARKLAVGGRIDDLKKAVDDAAAELAFVSDLDAIRMRRTLWKIDSFGKQRFESATSPAAFQESLQKRGFNVAADDIEQLAKRIAASPLKPELLAALDEWSVLEKSDDLRDRVLAVARRADPGPWLDRFRDPILRQDKKGVLDLARTAKPAELSPAVLCVLADLMKQRVIDPSPLLLSAQLVHPTDFLIAYAIARWFFELQDKNPQRERETRIKAVAFYRLARALRPDSATMLIDLGSELGSVQDLAGAETCFREASRLDPTSNPAFHNLGHILKQKGDLIGAESAMRTAVALDPTAVDTRINLGTILRARDDLPGAIREFRAAVALDPNSAAARNALGLALVASEDYEGGIREYRAATEANPKGAAAYANLGVVLSRQRKFDEALKMFQRAIEIDDANADAHFNYAVLLMSLKRYEDADAEFQRTIEITPDDEAAYTNYGVLLVRRGYVERGIAQFRIALKLNPKVEAAQANLTRAEKMLIGRDKIIAEQFGLPVPEE